MRYFSAYNQTAGFRFSVERLHNLKDKVPHVVITSIGPPAHLYGAPAKKTPDVAVFSDYQPDTPFSSLQFMEAPLVYTGLPLTIKLGFIFDVKQVKVLSGGTATELVDYGWTFCAIYSLLENEDASQSLYCHSGLHAVRIISEVINFC